MARIAPSSHGAPQGRRNLAVVVMVGLLSACVSPAPSPVVARTTAVPVPLGPTLEDRVAKLERILASHSLSDIIQQLDTLQRDISQLRGALELQTHEGAGAAKRQRELYLDTDRRLLALESGLNGITIKLGVLETQTSQLSAIPSSASSTADTGGESVATREEQDYQHALDAIKDGKTDDAIERFQAYLKQHPAGQLRDNAYYWLGEAYLAGQKPKLALDAFNAILTQFPNSEKLADAQLKVGYAYYDLKDWGKAKSALETARKKYPDSPAAKLADKRLKQIKLEGH